MITKTNLTEINPVSSQVSNYDGVLKYMCVDIKRSIRLTSYMHDSLTALFGEHNIRFKGEFDYTVWMLSYGGEVFEIYTNKNKGTVICLTSHTAEEEQGKICMFFLKELDDMLLNLSDSSTHP